MIERPFPRGARWLIGCYLVLIALALAAGSGLGLVMSFEMWDPPGTLGQATYVAVFRAHGLTMAFGALWPGTLVLANLAASSALCPARQPTTLFGFAGLAAWTVSFGLLEIALLAPGDSLDVLFLLARVSFPLMAASHALTLVHLLATLGAGRRRPSGWLAVAGTVGPIAWMCLRWASVLWSDATLFEAGLALMADMSPLYVIAACSVLPYFIEKSGGRWPGTPWIAAVMIAVGGIAQLDDHMALAAGGMLALWCFALSALRAVWAGRAALDRSPGPLVLVALAVVPAFALFAPLQALLSQVRPDVPLHDTYADVARFHLFSAIILVTLLVGVQACWAELATRACAPRLACASAVLLGSGIVVTTVAMWMAGTSGMARGYFEYDPVFETLHRTIGVGALLAIAGAVLAVAALFAGPRVVDARAQATGQIFE